jgi:four helix bundle protein
MANHEHLKVWQRAQALSIDMHRAAARFRPGVAPGLRPQLLRAVASIPANIAEGLGQGTDAQFAHGIGVAIGSANEAQTHLGLARALGMIPPAEGARMDQELNEIRRMLYGLRKSLHTRKPGKTTG